MKLEGTIQKEKRKKESRRKREKIIQKVLYTVIGIPYSKIEKMYLDFQTKQWEKDEEKSKQKVVQELVRYIQKDLVSSYDGCCVIYNASETDEVNYQSALFLKHFHYEVKHSKQMQIFQRVFMKKWSERENYFDYFFEEIYKYYVGYDDLDVERATETHWGRSYEYIKLEMKK